MPHLDQIIKELSGGFPNLISRKREFVDRTDQTWNHIQDWILEASEAIVGLGKNKLPRPEGTRY